MISGLAPGLARGEHRPLFTMLTPNATLYTAPNAALSDVRTAAALRTLAAIEALRASKKTAR